LPEGKIESVDSDEQFRWRPSGRVIAVVATLALLAKILLALRTYGTNDVYRWELYADLSRALGVGLYRAAWDFNHPPGMIHALRLLNWIAIRTGLPFAFWLRMPGILADAGSLWLVWKILGSSVEERSRAWALLLLAAAPPLILIAGFHGNTDTLMIFFLLLAVYLAERGESLPAGCAFGLAVSVKLVPLMAGPAILFYLSSLRRQIRFFAAAALVVLIAWSPFLFQDPAAIVSQVFGYRGIYGHWGLSWLALHLAGRNLEFGWFNQAFHDFGAYIALGAVLIASVWMNWPIGVRRSELKPRLFSQVGIIFFLFLSLSNGFGLQYLAWLVPWVVELGVLATAMYYAVSGIFLFLVYDYWSQGFPWYLADSNRVGDYQGHMDYSQLLCWLTIVLVLWAAWMRMKSGVIPERWLSARIPGGAWQVSAGLLTAVLVGYPLAGWIREQAPISRIGAGKDALQEIRAQQYQEISFRLYQLARYQDAVATGEESLKFDAGSADSYNLVAASYAALHQWDKAIANAEGALRIRPGFQLAKNNLAWARAEKGEAGEVSAASPLHTAQYFLNVSLQYYEAGRYQDCIAAAREALQRDPDMAEAYNNLAAGSASLGMWDEAIRAANEAIRIKPDFQLARNNLAWALDQKRKTRN